ncbi:hypothetical protein F4779DRAFT_29843 [Xylariaceae sp. FL0662B]|nr:hypothetical protein F4779DRAFT_29843 [Xylariaceae sp. FL0662B]
MSQAPPASNTSSAPAGYAPAKRTPTDSSYYDFNGVHANKYDPNSATWMYARDARAQQAGLPPTMSMKNPPNATYPSRFGNAEGLPLTTPGRPNHRNQPTWVHHPLTPGETTTWPAHPGPPGAVRSAYTDGNPNQFDVMVHDPRAGVSRRGVGQFVLAPYHPAAKP